jgi:hypothetical protein
MNGLFNALDWLARIAGIGALFGVAAMAAARLVSKLWADTFLERRKAELQKEVEKLKGELTNENEKLKADLAKEGDTHKWNLKKKEILLKREFEAADEFFELRREIEPRYRHPEMEWNDAAEDVIQGFGKTEDKLRKYIARHAAVLTPENRAALDQCQEIASNNQYAATHGSVVGREEEDLVERFLKLLKEVEDRFISELRA